MKRLISVGNAFGAASPFSSLFEKTVVLRRGDILEKPITKDDTVIFCGGEDISPTLYNQKPNRYCGATETLSSRDLWELEMYILAEKAGASMIGICRGAQLMCALNGGSLYQHVTNHSGSNHKMTTNEGETIEVCSVHHQMMNPMNTEHEVLAWATTIISTVHLGEKEKDIPVEIEPEVIYFPKTRGIAIQYHPEFMNGKEKGVQYARDVVSKYLLGE